MTKLFLGFSVWSNNTHTQAGDSRENMEEGGGWGGGSGWWLHHQQHTKKGGSFLNNDRNFGGGRRGAGTVEMVMIMATLLSMLKQLNRITHKGLGGNKKLSLHSFPAVGIVRKVPSTTSTTQQQTSPQW